MITNLATMREIFQNARVIAVVGHSDKPHRTSYQIALQLRQFGYTVYPVNPTIEQVDGQESYATLHDVPEPIDIVNVFRQSHHLPMIVEEAIEVGAKVIWGQLNVINLGAAERAEEAGLQVIMDNCIKVTYRRVME